MTTETLKHTPGPWEFEEINGGYTVSTTDDDVETARSICTTHLHGNRQYNTPQDEANARLMAAAPELLEAGQMTLGYMRTLARRTHIPEVKIMLEACVGKLEASIAKAKGKL